VQTALTAVAVEHAAESAVAVEHAVEPAPVVAVGRIAPTAVESALAESVACLASVAVSETDYPASAESSEIACLASAESSEIAAVVFAAVYPASGQLPGVQEEVRRVQ
jgi:hypothetical protein